MLLQFFCSTRGAFGESVPQSTSSLTGFDSVSPVKDSEFVPTYCCSVQNPFFKRRATTANVSLFQRLIARPLDISRIGRHEIDKAGKKIRAG
jgi:hypothetical protein